MNDSPDVYTAASADLQTETGGSADYAGFWLRVAAIIIDGIVISMVFALLIFVSGVIGFGDLDSLSETGESAFIGMILGYNAVTIVLQWLYFALQESSAGQATLGKRAVGIIVTDLDGERVSFMRATGRHFGKILSSMILLIGFIMVAFTQHKQGLHDMIAGTLVVKK
ncbi:MAG: RDD family protein [Porticoccaceae bacterium]|nr:RDD family protein [Porticoccaceae bacterium]